MSLRRAAVVTLVLAAAASSCRGCGERGPTSLRDLPAPEAGAAFLADDLGRLVEGAAAYVTRLTRDAGAHTVQRTRASMKQQLGLDPLDVDSWREWGIDTGGGLIVFTEGSEAAPILAVAVADREKFDTALEALLTRTDGASKLSEKTVGPFTMRLAGRPFGNEVAPSMQWAHAGRFVLVSRAEGRAALEKALERLGQPRAGGEQPGLASDATFHELTGKLPEGEALVFARGSAARGLVEKEAASLSEGTATSIRIGGDGFRAESFLSLAVPGLREALAGPAPLDLAERVGQDAVVVALSGSAQPEAVAALRSQPTAAKLIDRALAPLGEEVGIDPEKEILPLLAGPLTLSVHLEKLEGLPSAIRQRRASLDGLLDWLHVVITAQVKDAAGMQAMLERSRAALGARGLTVTRSEREIAGRKVTVFAPEPRKSAPAGAEPKLGWALVDDTYVYAAGPGRLERALTQLITKGPSVAPELGEAAKELAGEAGTSVLVLRAGAIADAASGVTVATEAQGMDALVGTAVALLRALGDVAVSVSAEPDGLRIKVLEQLR